jgi:flagellar capping protein FliD
MSNSYDFEENGKFYFNTKNRKGQATVCECRQCVCGKWVSVNTIDTPHHLARAFHKAWAEANGEPITQPYNIGAITSKKEDLVKSLNKVGEQMDALKASINVDMNRLITEFNRLSVVIDKMVDNTDGFNEDEDDESETGEKPEALTDLPMPIFFLYSYLKKKVLEFYFFFHLSK